MANDGQINIENLFTLFLRIFSSSNYYEIRIIAGMGQAPHLWNWVIGKGVQVAVRWRSADQTEKQEISLHVARILLVGVLGQNVTGTKSHGHNVADKILWGQNVIGQNVQLFCPRHFVQWHFVHITFCPRHFFRDILSGDISSGHPCKYTAPVQSARRIWGYVESQNQKFRQWLLVRTVSGWLVCDRSNRWIVDVGFIASRSEVWFVCWYRSFGRIYGRWLACRLDCLLSSLSVGWTIRPACYIQLITLTSQPTIYLRSVLEFPESKVRRFLVFVRLVGCGGATWPMFVKSLAKFGAYFI